MFFDSGHLVRTLCIQTFIRVTLSAFCYDVAHVVIDMYICKKFHGFIGFGFFLAMLV